jgi:hypothetical protein
MNCSLNQAPFALTIGVTVTAPPVPPPAALTVRPIVVVRVSVPAVPLMVTVETPVAAVLAALNVTTLLDPAAGVGLKAADTPVGSPVTVNATLPAKPPVRTIPIALVAAAPWLTATLDGLAESEKSTGGGAFTVTLIETVRVSPPADREKAGAHRERGQESRACGSCLYSRHAASIRALGQA